MSIQRRVTGSSVRGIGCLPSSVFYGGELPTAKLAWVGVHTLSTAEHHYSKMDKQAVGNLMVQLLSTTKEERQIAEKQL